MSNDSRRIVGRNLTARAAHRVAGNPDISRPEDSVGNCFPGLDLDVRSLDRRFFPGLVFDFVDEGKPVEKHRLGALLRYPDGYGDTDLRPEYLHQLDSDEREQIDAVRRRLYTRLVGDDGQTLCEGEWFLDWIEQGGCRIAMHGDDGPLNGSTVWRIVRGLEPRLVKVGLRRRDKAAEPGLDHMELEGWRRRFTSPSTGVISTAYEPGELQMSMCSPWQHDFRDCACHYWASNRPDVVLGEVAPDVLASGGNDSAVRRIDWMRSDRSQAAASASLNTMEANRPFQMDHFQINRTWQDLAVVIGNREIGEVLETRRVESGPAPFHDKRELLAHLRQLAGVEMTLALEYLYAYFSLVDPRESSLAPGLAAAARTVRQHLLTIAVGEMQHLRWVNEMLWSLDSTRPFVPVVEPAPKVPLGSGNERDRALRPLDGHTLLDFIAGEAPSASVDGQYMRVVATLAAESYAPGLRDLASLIVADGVEHHAYFRTTATLLKPYLHETPLPFLRSIRVGSVEEAGAAVAAFREIQRLLVMGYTAMANGDLDVGQGHLDKARDAMRQLLDEGERLAAQGIGIPFWA